MKLIRSLLPLTLIAVLASTLTAQEAHTPEALCAAAEPAPPTTMQFDAAEDVLEPDADYRAIFCTSAGAIYVDLYERLTPMTVNNFVFLAEQGYYDSSTFHRVIPGFMAQGGDPTGTGQGGPGYRFGDEPVGFLTFDRPGLLAMANAGPGTNGSQFFITTAPAPHLNHKHTVFGDVLLGQDIVEAIRERDPATASAEGETLRAVMIISDADAVTDGDLALPAPATQEQVAAAFEAFSRGLPPTYPTNAERSGLFTTEQIAEIISPGLQEAFAEYAASYGHQYRYRAEIDNVNCDQNIYFTSLGYQVDVFESAAAASNALADELTRLSLESQGYAGDADSAAYSRARPTCADEDGLQTLTLYTYGRFLVSIDVLIAERVLEQAGVSGAAVLADLSLQIEGSFGDLYLPEMRV